MRLKHFYVVTYDISDTRRRDRVVKILEAIGHRVNFSVFECFLTDIQYRNMCDRLTSLVVGKDDQVNIYPICSECYARIKYIPLQRPKESTTVVVV